MNTDDAEKISILLWCQCDWFQYWIFINVQYFNQILFCKRKLTVDKLNLGRWNCKCNERRTKDVGDRARRRALTFWGIPGAHIKYIPKQFITSSGPLCRRCYIQHSIIVTAVKQVQAGVRNFGCDAPVKNNSNVVLEWKYIQYIH